MLLHCNTLSIGFVVIQQSQDPVVKVLKFIKTQTVLSEEFHINSSCSEVCIHLLCSDGLNIMPRQMSVQLFHNQYDTLKQLKALVVIYQITKQK